MKSVPTKGNGDKKPVSIGKHKHRVKLREAVELGERYLTDLEPYYEAYVRSHRLLRGCDPDPEEVSNTWPEDATYDE